MELEQPPLHTLKGALPDIPNHYPGLPVCTGPAMGPSQRTRRLKCITPPPPTRTISGSPVPLGGHITQHTAQRCPAQSFGHVWST